MIRVNLHSLLSVGVAALLLAACDRRQEGTYQGYAEGEYVRVGPIDGGTIDAIPVRRGDKVADGALLFQLDATAEIAAQAQAAAQLAQATSQYQDLLKGLRAPELEQIVESRANAAASLKKAQFDFARTEQLYGNGNASKAALDSARAARDAAAASVRELDAKLVTGKMSARQDQVDAAQAAVKAAQAALDQANWRLSRREGHTPQGGTVEDIFFRVGEFASATQPVVSVLPPQNIKVRFFVPEPELGGVHVGDRVSLTCDGCPAGLIGRVRFISTQAEFTPPVIYSEQSQAKLVYMAEAWPEKAPEDFHPGQPVRVALQQAE